MRARRDDMAEARTNGIMPSIAVSRAMLATAPGRRKLEVVWDSPNPKAFVRRLPAEDLYFAIREIGLTDSAEIVGLATPKQFQAFVDLDAWEQFAPDPKRVLLWMRLAIEGAQESEDFRKKRAALDPELVVLVLKTQTRVHPLEEGVDPVLESDNWLRTAEGKYLVEILAEGDDGVTVRKLLEDYIAEDPFTATRLFEAVRWEVSTELEESSLRWRTGRLRDMGFPEFEEAIRIWTPVQPGWKPRTAAPEPGPVAGVPALLLASSAEKLFLDRVAARLPDEHRTLFNEGLIYLLNCALVADGIDPKDLDLARDSLQSARDMLSLGLELASGGDEDAALGVLATTPPSELFRSAVAVALELSREADRAAKGVSFGESKATSIESPDSEILTGLRRRRPRLYEPLVEGEPVKKDRVEWRALRTPGDLASARAAIARTRAAGGMLAAIGVDAEAFRRLAEAAGRGVVATSVGQVLATAALRAAAGEAPRPDPLTAGEVSRLCELFEGGRLTAVARERYEAFLRGLAGKLPEADRAAAGELEARWRERFESELGAPCAAGGLEARFIECALVEASLTA